MAEVRQILSDIPVFSTLNDSQLDVFSRVATKQLYSAGQDILLENDSTDHSFFVIIDGQVKVFTTSLEGKEATLANLGNGDFFGEMSLLDGEMRSASVRALKPSELLVIRRPDFLAELKKHPELGISLLVEMSRRMRRADEQVTSLSLLSSYGRIASTLLMIAKDRGERVKKRDGTEITVIRDAPSYQEIANTSRTTEHMVSSALNHLQNSGLLITSGHDIYILQESDLFR